MQFLKIFAQPVHLIFHLSSDVTFLLRDTLTPSAEKATPFPAVSSHDFLYFTCFIYFKFSAHDPPRL
jgi:hypothetical protein